MIIHRSHPESQFVIIPNATLRDPRLGYAARGVLGEILTRPDEWVTTADAMWRRAKSERGKAGEGRKVLRDAFNELIAAGYIYRQRQRRGGGQFVTELHVFDVSDGLEAWLAASEFLARAESTLVDNQPAGDVSAGRTDDQTGGGRSGLREHASSQVAPTTSSPVAGQPVAGQPVAGELVVSTKTDDEDMNMKIFNGDQDDENHAGILTERAEVESDRARSRQDQIDVRAAERKRQLDQRLAEIIASHADRAEAAR